MGMRGQKARTYCVDDKTVTVMNYNGLNEDPLCLRPYPSDARNYTSYTVSTGGCVRVNYNHWAKVKVEPYDGREFKWNPEWDNMFQMDGNKEEPSGQQQFQFQGDGYSVEVNLD